MPPDWIPNVKGRNPMQMRERKLLAAAIRRRRPNAIITHAIDDGAGLFVVSGIGGMLRAARVVDVHYPSHTDRKILFAGDRVATGEFYGPGCFDRMAEAIVDRWIKDTQGQA